MCGGGDQRFEPYDRRATLTQGGAQIPKKIDRYEIIEAVGFGAMGAVYRAFDPLIKRSVAVKTLRVDVLPQSPDYKAFLERFETEARTAGRLSHPNIITLYDVGHTDGDGVHRGRDRRRVPRR